MDCCMSWVQVLEGSRREYDCFLVENVDRRLRGPAGQETDSFSKTRAHQMGKDRALVPPFEGWPTQFHIVDFEAFLEFLSNIQEERLLRLQLIKHSVDQVDTQDTDSLLLERVGRIIHVDMQHDVARGATGAQLESQADPAVRLVCSGIVAGGDGINIGKEASLRPSALVQLVDELGPFAVHHGFEAFFGNVTGAGTVQIVANFLVIRRDGFSNSPGGSSNYQKPPHDFLAGTNFGKGAIAGRIQIDAEGFLMSAKLFRGCHRLGLPASLRISAMQSATRGSLATTVAKQRWRDVVFLQRKQRKAYRFDRHRICEIALVVIG